MAKALGKRLVPRIAIPGIAMSSEAAPVAVPTAIDISIGDARGAGAAAARAFRRRAGPLLQYAYPDLRIRVVAPSTATATTAATDAGVNVVRVTASVPGGTPQTRTLDAAKVRSGTGA